MDMVIINLNGIQFYSIWRFIKELYHTKEQKRM